MEWRVTRFQNTRNKIRLAEQTHGVSVAKTLPD